MLRIIRIFAMISVFWALFDQHASSWVEQARAMDRTLNILGWEVTPLPSQVSAANPIMVMILIPFMSFVGYPTIEKVLRIKMTPLRRITGGFFIAALSFAMTAMFQRWLDAGETVSIGWQILAYLVITTAEVMVSITGLEFAYTQAPKSMKSLIMGFWLFTVAVGNVIVIAFSKMKDLPWETFFWSFSAMAVGAGIVFAFLARLHTYRNYTQ